MVLTPIGAYTVDIMPSRSAELMAAISYVSVLLAYSQCPTVVRIIRALRSLLLTPVSGLFIPSVETIGVAATNTITGILALFGYLYVSRGRCRA